MGSGRCSCGDADKECRPISEALEVGSEDTIRSVESVALRGMAIAQQRN